MWRIFFSAEQVARQFGVAIAACDRQAVHQSVRNRVLGKKKMLDMITYLGCVTTVAEVVVEASVYIDGVASKTNAKRVGQSGRKRKDDGELPSNRLKKHVRGADSFLRYQTACKAEATEASILIRDQNMSYRAAGKSMQAAPKEKGVLLHESTCRVQLIRALHNGCISLDPQRSGGQALPSAIEKDIAEVVKRMREQHYPVFPDDVLKWAAEAIEGTDAASYFPDGKPTKGWYHGWLRRMEFLTGALRPLELTRKEWYTAENLATYTSNRDTA